MDEPEKKQKELIDGLIATNVLKTKQIIDAFREVPRHNFVLQGYKHYAYDNTPLPIVKSATISEPSTVAIMLEILEPKKGEKILEIGTGSGWQACLLSKIVSDSGKVVTIEIDEDVFKFGKANIEKTKTKNVKPVLGDGSVGYPPDSPYNKIIYTAAAPEISPNVVKQLAIGGRVIAPVGTTTLQKLVIIDKMAENKTEKSEDGFFQFVPLKGKQGFD